MQENSDHNSYDDINAESETDTSPVPSPFFLDKTTSEKIRIHNTLRERGKRQAEKAVSYPYNASDSKGNPKSTLDNVVIFLRHNPRYAGTVPKLIGDTVFDVPAIYYDRFYNKRYIEGEKHEDFHTSDIRIHIEQQSGMEKIGKDLAADAIDYIARENQRDTIIEWFQHPDNTWDGKQRLERWLIDAIPGTPDDEYHRAVGFSWLLALARRQLNPGEFFKHVLTLIGPNQSMGKTSLFPTLLAPIDKNAAKIVTGDINDPDTIMQLVSGTLIANIDEGAAFNKREARGIKTFISKQEDEVRAKYGRESQTYPRRFVFGMTENNYDALNDPTGNVRYWIVEVNYKIDFEWLEANAKQLLAEAWHHAKIGTAYMQPPESYANEIQNRHRDISEWEIDIYNHLMRSVAYCEDPANYFISTEEVWREALGFSEDEMRKKKGSWADRKAVADAMKALLMTSTRNRVGSKQVRGYMIQQGTLEKHKQRINDYKKESKDSY